LRERQCDDGLIELNLRAGERGNLFKDAANRQLVADSVAKVLFHYRPKFFWAADAIFG
jgi:hypothetical protein